MYDPIVHDRKMALARRVLILSIIGFCGGVFFLKQVIVGPSFLSMVGAIILIVLLLTALISIGYLYHSRARINYTKNLTKQEIIRYSIIAFIAVTICLISLIVR